MKLIEAGGEGFKGQDSDIFKAEVVQHLLSLQVSHPQLREAIQEVCVGSAAMMSCAFSFNNVWEQACLETCLGTDQAMHDARSLCARRLYTAQACLLRCCENLVQGTSVSA